MTKKLVKKKSKLVVVKKVAKKKAPAKRNHTVKSVTSEPSTSELRERLEQDEREIRESQVAPLLVKCRFCDALIPKPDSSTVYECDEHKNLTGDAKFNSLGQRTMV